MSQHEPANEPSQRDQDGTGTPGDTMSDDTTHDVASLRRHLLTYNNGRHAHLAERPDDDLAAAITTAREWVGGRRYSWTTVAKNVLADGRPHA